MNAIKKFMQDEEGAVAIEYGLLAALIAIVIIFGASALGTSLCELFNGIAKVVADPIGVTYAPAACK